LIGLVTLANLIGCRGESGPEMVNVSGRVSYQGKPLSRGTITFLPEGDGQPASGTIGSDGSYRLQTIEPGDGARTGRYKVIVSTSDLNVETLDTAMLPSEMPKGKTLTPAKFEKPETSGLTAEIKSGGSTLDFNLE
jgi:hypothetical protein